MEFFIRAILAHAASVKVKHLTEAANMQFKLTVSAIIHHVSLLK